MSRNEIVKALDESIEELLGSKVSGQFQADRDLSCKDVGIDSLDILDVFIAVEDRLKVEIDHDKVKRLSNEMTFNQVVDAILQAI